MKPTFQEITDEERNWIDEQLAAGSAFVARYSPRHSHVTLESLDAAWAAWMAESPTHGEDINRAINCVGIPFGALLVATGEFEWCIASDDWGTDLAVRGLPDRGDVTVYPADFVSKRWESRTVDFLTDAFSKIMEHVAKMRLEWDSAES